LLEFNLPPELPAEVLARRNQLPLKPTPVTLTGRWVRLEPLQIERDAETLFAHSNGSPIRLGERSVEAYDADALIWRYLFDPPSATLAEFAAKLQGPVNAPNGLCLVVIDIASGQPVGATNFMSNSPEHLKIELGGIWYSPIVQRTPANTEATYLMLGHAFGLGYRRVEWKCHAYNERSRRAALRMGFKFEGIQESHMIIKGRSRDTAWYRILEDEWPEVKAHLEQLLNQS
jgi:RimJ/RimL family protein N-acetyltransferase